MDGCGAVAARLVRGEDLVVCERFVEAFDGRGEGLVEERFWDGALAGDCLGLEDGRGVRPVVAAARLDDGDDGVGDDLGGEYLASVELAGVED